MVRISFCHPTELVPADIASGGTTAAAVGLVACYMVYLAQLSMCAARYEIWTGMPRTVPRPGGWGRQRSRMGGWGGITVPRNRASAGESLGIHTRSASTSDGTAGGFMGFDGTGSSIVVSGLTARDLEDLQRKGEESTLQNIRSRPPPDTNPTGWHRGRYASSQTSSQ